MYLSYCEFCQQFSGLDTDMSTKLDQELGTTCILRRENGVVTMVGVGPLTMGYVLVCPVDHYYSIAALPDELLAEVLRQKASVLELLTEVFGSAMCFEHGAVDSQTRGGSCVDHAHLHIIQGCTGLRELVAKDYTELVINEIADLKEFVQRGEPYLLIQDQEKTLYAYHIPQRIKSQYLRQQWAKAVKRPREWDWTLFPNYELMKATISLIAARLSGG